MTPKLTDDQRRALRSRPEGPVPVEDEQTRKVYVIVDQEVHLKAMEALRDQEDQAAIQAGIDDMEAGRVVPFEEVDARIRQRLGMPPRV
jgi:predicted transcriptional regulator